MKIVEGVIKKSVRQLTMGIDKTGFVSHRDVVLKRHFRFEKAAKKIFSKKNSMYFAIWWAFKKLDIYRNVQSHVRISGIFSDNFIRAQFFVIYHSAGSFSKENHVRLSGRTALCWSLTLLIYWGHERRLQTWKGGLVLQFLRVNIKKMMVSSENARKVIEKRRRYVFLYCL